MELTNKEQLEINKFSTKYPAVWNIIALLEKKTDDPDKEISKLKAELQKHQKTVGLHSDRI